jgi:hypothetical protein
MNLLPLSVLATLGIVNSIKVIIPGREWTLFDFDTISKARFEFQTSTLTFLQLTDLYCKGDAFALYDGGRLLVQSPQVKKTCDGSTGDPQATFQNPAWSSILVTLSAGLHNITVDIISNPYGAGTAAICLTSQ